MQDFLFTADGFVNLDNVCYICPHGAAVETKTDLQCPGLIVTINMPYPEFKVLLEKQIKDRYEFSVKMAEHNRQRQNDGLSQILKNTLDKWPNT